MYKSETKDLSAAEQKATDELNLLLLAYTELELSQSFDKRHWFDITYSASELKTKLDQGIAALILSEKAYFDDADISRLFWIIHRNLSDSLNPFLNGICHMRNDLYSFAKVVPSPLL